MRLFNDTLSELAVRRPHTIVLVDEVEALAGRRVGLDGRHVCKLVLSALARRPEVALNPERLLVDDLLTLLEGEQVTLRWARAAPPRTPGPRWGATGTSRRSTRPPSLRR
jgi:hypothetical protein